MEAVDAMEAMNKDMDAKIDVMLAAAFDGTATGSTRAVRVHHLIFAVLSGGITWCRTVAALVLRLKKLPSLTLDDCAREVRKFVADMEREGVSVSELVAGGKTVCSAEFLEVLATTRTFADNVAPRLSPAFGSSATAQRAAVWLAPSCRRSSALAT